MLHRFYLSVLTPGGRSRWELLAIMSPPRLFCSSVLFLWAVSVQHAVADTVLLKSLHADAGAVSGIFPEDPSGRDSSESRGGGVVL